MPGQAAARMNIVRDPDGNAVALPDWRADIYPTRTGAGDVTIQSPRNMEWHVLYVWAILSTDATQANRQLVLEVYDPNNALCFDVHVGAIQGASVTRYYAFGPSLADLLAFRNTDWIMTPIPPTLVLPPRSRIRVRDDTGASAGDVLTVRVGYAERLIG